MQRSALDHQPSPFEILHIPSEVIHMRQSIQDRSILLTGGVQGLGEDAKFLTQRGARVTITGRRADRIRALAESLGPNCHWVAGDVCNPRGPGKNACRSRAPWRRTARGLINNAGITTTSGLAGIDAAALQQVFDTNVSAPCC